jgi:hypothetical protein
MADLVSTSHPVPAQKPECYLKYKLAFNLSSAGGRDRRIDNMRPPEK